MHSSIWLRVLSPEMSTPTWLDCVNLCCRCYISNFKKWKSASLFMSHCTPTRPFLLIYWCTNFVRLISSCTEQYMSRRTNSYCSLMSMYHTNRSQSSQTGFSNIEKECETRRQKSFHRLARGANPWWSQVRQSSRAIARVFRCQSGFDVTHRSFSGCGFCLWGHPKWSFKVSSFDSRQESWLSSVYWLTGWWGTIIAWWQKKKAASMHSTKTSKSLTCS